MVTALNKSHKNAGPLPAFFYFYAVINEKREALISYLLVF